MTTADAAPARRASRVLAGGASGVLAVVVLAVAVVLMHSMGAGHQMAPAVTAADGMGHLPSSAAAHDDEAHGPAAVAAGEGARVVAQVSAACADDCVEPADAGHTMGAGALCLAMLSTVLLRALLLALRRRRDRSGGATSRSWPCAVVPSRGPPRCLALSLAQVCVLRT